MPSWKKLIVSGSDASLNSLNLASSFTAGNGAEITKTNENVLRLINSSGQPSLIKFNDTSTTNDPYIGSYGNETAFGIYGVGESMRIDASRQVGIGTADPNHKLDIYSNENVPLRIHRPSNANLDSAGAWGIGFSTRGDSSTSTTDTRAGIFSYYNGNIFLATSTSDVTTDPDGNARLTVTNTGNVGIGTMGPGAKLDIHAATNSNGILIREDTDDSITHNFYIDGSDNGVAAFYANGQSTKILLNTAGTSYFNGGNIGIGTTSPSGLLHLSSSSTTAIMLDSDTSTQQYEIGTGYAGVGSGNSFYIYDNTAAASRLSISSTGVVDVSVLRATGDVIAYYSSDKELKDNIIPIENALEKVEALGGYEFDWNDKQDIYNGHDIGVIAQEVEAVFPELVQTRENGYKAVKYEKLTAVLLQAVKELAARVKELENK